MDRHHVNAQAASEPGGKSTSDHFDHGPHSITHGFVSDTMIATLSGEKPVQHLLPGDRVLTRDSGYQPLLATE
ncbi:MAG: Hint domain-containing protein, partial [Albidovulum sp.]